MNSKDLSTYGSDFYIGFLRQYLADGTIQIRIHTFETSSVSFNISSKTGYSYVGTTSASSPATVTIPTLFQVRNSGYEYRNLGLQITSLPTNPITVSVIDILEHDPQLTHVTHPYMEQLTTAYTYYAVSESKFLHTLRYSQILVVSSWDNTTVTITPTQNISIPENPQLCDSIYMYLKMLKGDSDTFTKCSPWANIDLSGTTIVSNHPITVISGHDCAQIPTEYHYSDPISTQIPPTVCQLGK